MSQPKPGFDWTRVNWGGPDQPQSDICSYCDDEIPDECVAFLIFTDTGWCARFCDACAATWFGFRLSPL